jgi:hypothetical protein
LNLSLVRQHKKGFGLMFLRKMACACAVVLAANAACAHGPQIQTTQDASGKIVTRKILVDDYTSTLTEPIRVYCMPLGNLNGAWLARPSEIPGGPGLAYGYGYDALTNPEPFPAGSQFILSFVDGLKKWDGAAFVDAGITEVEAYRGSSLSPSALAKTTDLTPYNSFAFPPNNGTTSFGISFAVEQAETHNTVNYRMLGDGSSSASLLGDGIYLLSLQLGSTDSSITSSDPFYFVLAKNARGIGAAVASLGIDASQIQFIPEPATAAIALVTTFCLAGGRPRGS